VRLEEIRYALGVGLELAPPGVRIQLGPSSAPVTSSAPAPPSFLSRAWVDCDTLEMIGSALHPKADPSHQAGTKTRDRDVPTASTVHVTCATPERVAEVAAALEAGEIPPDDPDEPPLLSSSSASAISSRTR
jgi:hypothetical protein